MSFLSDRRIRTSLVAIAADSLLIGLKAGLAVFTGSKALWADALHSGTDLLVSLVLLASLVIRHLQERKVAASGVEKVYRIESVMALFVALSILYVPYEIISQVRQAGASAAESVSGIWVGIIGVLITILVAYFMAQLKTSVGRDTQSPALEADGYHSHLDVLSSMAVLLSFVGLLMGLYLDHLVAVLIAVLVGIAGIELLISGLRSLLLGQELVQLSASDAFFSLLQKSVAGQKLVDTVWRCWGGVRRVPPVLYVVGLLLLYAASGITQVPLGYVGVKLVFARVVGEPLDTGLHYHWPWPVGAIKQLSQQQVHRALIGTPLTVEQSGSPLLWQQWRESTDEPRDITEHFITADEALVNVTLAMQYQLSDWGRQWTSANQIEAMINAYATSALSQAVARYRFDDLLNDVPDDFLSTIQRQVEQSLATVGLTANVLNLRLLKVQPPSQTVALYRDMFVAQQESVRLKLLAEAENFQQVHTASAEKILLASEASASQLEQQIIATGDAGRFASMADIFRTFPKLIEFNRYLEHIQNTLADRQLTIIDQSFDNRDLRVWGGAKQDVLLPDIRLKP
ncbi:cation transporter [Gynuella sunshinyii]|uniref:Putative Co/Zn/Cd cation transporter n=1 Tax=Gynuella sunshinyii YC6258 TaxID=1445510 RepID=A0A0C5VQN3_9GAMM|nr:cation transporter [Gynuella sunshinyii]AJQ96907.1 putative Co/Zn/Cd cation transporter [Gynuella sunshinyii YC6258]